MRELCVIEPNQHIARSHHVALLDENITDATAERNINDVQRRLDGTIRREGPCVRRSRVQERGRKRTGQPKGEERSDTYDPRHCRSVIAAPSLPRLCDADLR